jgi:hypothetical protein
LDVNKVGYTYKQETLGYYSCIDHVFVQKHNLGAVLQFAVLDEGYNFSDHCALRVTLSCDLLQVQNDSSHYDEHKSDCEASLLWSAGDVVAYLDLCEEGFAALERPASFNCIYPCAQSEHKCDVSNYANGMVEVLHKAAKACFPLRIDAFQLRSLSVNYLMHVLFMAVYLTRLLSLLLCLLKKIS